MAVHVADEKTLIRSSWRSKGLLRLQAPQQDNRTVEAKNHPAKEGGTEQHSTAQAAELSVGAETEAEPASEQQQQQSAVSLNGGNAQQEAIAALAEGDLSLEDTEESRSAAGQSASFEAGQKASTDAPAAAAAMPELSKKSAPAAESSQAEQTTGAGTAAPPEATSTAEVPEGIETQQTEDAVERAASSQTEQKPEAGALAASELSKEAQASEGPMAELAEEAAAGVKGTTEAGQPHEAANGDKIEAPATDTGDSLPPPVAAATARAAEAGAEL